MVIVFSRAINEIYALLGCYVALMGMNDAQHPEEQTRHEPLTDSVRLRFVRTTLWFVVGIPTMLYEMLLMYRVVTRSLCMLVGSICMLHSFFRTNLHFS